MVTNPESCDLGFELLTAAMSKDGDRLHFLANQRRAPLTSEPSLNYLRMILDLVARDSFDDSRAEGCSIFDIALKVRVETTAWVFVPAEDMAECLRSLESNEPSIAPWGKYALATCVAISVFVSDIPGTLELLDEEARARLMPSREPF